MKGTVFVVTQKKPNIILPDGYQWIQSGTVIHERLDNMVHDDDIEDNRSSKNPYYSEYSAHYYLWRTCKDIDYIGIAHYRRFFDDFSWKIQPITEKHIGKLLAKYDVILPSHERFPISNEDIYKKYHDIEDLYTLYSVLDNYDSEFGRYFKKFMQGKAASLRNVFIGKTSTISTYWEWIFGLFDELEKHISLDKNDAYQGRVFGYLAERLLEPWMLYNSKKIFYGFLYNSDYKHLYFKRVKYVIKRIIGVE